MEKCLENISYIKLGLYHITIIYRDRTESKGLNKFGPIYKEIKIHPDFIRINYKTWVHFCEVDKINHTQVFMCIGPVFRFGRYCKEDAIEKYLALLQQT